MSGAGPTGVGDWVLGHWFTNPSGAQVSVNTVDTLFAQSQGGPRRLPSPALTAWASPNTTTLQWWTYQPAARWWQLQLTEGAWLLAAALLLITATYRPDPPPPRLTPA